MRNTIGMIMQWFGDLPPWFELHLETLKRNPSIDWFILTPHSPPEKTPKNIHFIKFDFNDFRALIKEELGIEKPLMCAWETCCYRPAFGSFFKQHVKKYDFWGNFDADTMMGDIRKFMTPEILSNHMIITGCVGFLCGHFTLYRNIPEIRDYYKRPEIYEGYLHDLIHRAIRIEEQTHLRGWWKNIPIFNENYVINFSSKVDSHDNPNFNKPNQIHYWYNGKVIQEWMKNGKINTKEWMYIHFSGRYRDSKFKVGFKPLNAPHGWMVDAIGFHSRIPRTSKKFYL